MQVPYLTPLFARSIRWEHGNGIDRIGIVVFVCAPVTISIDAPIQGVPGHGTALCHATLTEFVQLVTQLFEGCFRCCHLGSSNLSQGGVMAVYVVNPRSV